MYVGRLLVVAPGLVAYRVSSRSFPNRRTYARGPGRIAVGPTEDAPEPDNPYVAYDCLRAVEGPAGPVAVAGNGSHVDPVAEKVERGYPARDALALALLALDFEKDEYDTPRIAAVAGPAGAHAGIVRRDALLVEAVTEPTLVATYERDRPEPFAFPVAGASDPDPGAAARAAYDLDFEHPVCAAAAVVDEPEADDHDGDEAGGEDAVTLGRYDGPGSDTAGGTGDG